MFPQSVHHLPMSCYVLMSSVSAVENCCHEMCASRLDYLLGSLELSCAYMVARGILMEQSEKP
eukprot:COSAG01_NODE_8984_length_2594_cov_1.443287_2_plen_63_part_00